MSDNPSIELVSTIHIAGVPLHLSATKEENDKWNFSGSISKDYTIKITELVEDIIKKCGIQRLPVKLPDVNLDTLWVNLNVGQKSDKKFKLAANFSILSKTITCVFTAKEKDYIWGVDFAPHLDLSSIPLFGNQLKDAFSIEELSIIFVKSTDEIGKFNIHELFEQPESANTSDIKKIEGINLPATFCIGGKTHTINLVIPTGATESASQVSKKENNQVIAAKGDNRNEQESTGLTKWFPVQKNIGPLQFKRIGLGWLSPENRLGFLLDAGISFSGLTIDFEGLCISFPLSIPLIPKPDLAGLEITYARGPLEISGGFIKLDNGYGGEAVIKAEDFCLSAVGAYREVNSHPSLFIFAELEKAIGGPPYLFITGLSGGFGYNSNFELPELDEVSDFPLIKGFKGGNSKNVDLLDVLAVLEGKKPGPDNKTRAWVAPKDGDIWFAVGIEFTSFNLVHSHALLALEFGHDFQLALLGLSKITLPPPPSDSRTFAYAELQLEASLKPSEGFFGLTAIISKNSYVLDKNCHLTGGFAFYLWFDGEHSGDFVITVGGYHPAFNVPAHYPKVPRLGFNWQVSNHVTIKGEAYFTLTPSCVMGGGALEALYHSGNLKAWFTVHADFLISWKPFYYLGSFGIGVGASYRMHLLFVTVTLKAELSCSVDIWGPPTGGKVHVHWFIISFTVGFGASRKIIGDTLDWEEFKSLLPKNGGDNEPDIIKIRINRGLLKEEKVENNNVTWIVRPDEFEFTTESAIPANELKYSSNNDQKYKSIKKIDEKDNLDIRPMRKENVNSTHTLIVSKIGESNIEANWRLNEHTRNVPEALWGKPVDGKPKSEAKTLPNRLVGFKVKTPVAEAGDSPGPIEIKENLSYTPVEQEGTLPLSTSVKPDFSILPVRDDNSIRKIMESLFETKERRDSIHSELKNILNWTDETAVTNSSVDRLAKSAGAIYPEAPMIYPDLEE